VKNRGRGTAAIPTASISTVSIPTVSILTAAMVRVSDRVLLGFGLEIGLVLGLGLGHGKNFVVWRKSG